MHTKQAKASTGEQRNVFCTLGVDTQDVLVAQRAPSVRPSQTGQASDFPHGFWHVCDRAGENHPVENDEDVGERLVRRTMRAAACTVRNRGKNLRGAQKSAQAAGSLQFVCSTIFTAAQENEVYFEVLNHGRWQHFDARSRG